MRPDAGALRVRRGYTFRFRIFGNVPGLRKKRARPGLSPGMNQMSRHESIFRAQLKLLSRY